MAWKFFTYSGLNIYVRSVNGRYDSDLDDALPKGYMLDEPYRLTNGDHDMDGNCEGLSCDEPEEDADAELMRRSKEAGERVILLSKKLERENFFPDGGYDVSTLIHTVRNLVEEKISLALEVSTLLRSQIADRTSAKEELSHVKTELEKEKNEMQSAFEKELDRRSSGWSFKLRKYQLQEQRLHERVRELAEQNVSLQREVSSFSEREMENKSVMTHADQQLKGLTDKTNNMKEEILDLQQNLIEIQEKYKIAEENRDFIRRNFEEKEKECKELQMSLSRLLRTCSEQEKTITGLQDGFSEDLHKNQSMESVDKHIVKMQMEQMRLAGVELALRKELESYRFEVDSLRHENIILLNRLKGDGKECVAATYKLDKELWARICCLQNEGLIMLNESTYLCSKLLEFIKGKGSYLRQSMQLDLEVIGNGLDGQFIVESEMKIQGLKKGTEGLTRSLQMMSSFLDEKSNPLTSKFHSECIEEDKFSKLNDQSSEMLKKVESINRLQSDLQESTRELSIMRGILSKVLEERDLMWEKVKQYSEQNLLLNSEVNVLKKKIEALDEDILVKEGQITILKDSCQNTL
ncbi:myosin-4 [Sesbania bispinosa]|nr:myosin-4 [Sesbania bispinosa]